MSQPELSVVVPAYNEAAHLEAVIAEMESVFDASHIDYEIIIVNNGSRDNTGEVIEKIHVHNPRITGLNLKVNQHYGGGVLAGVEKARGEVIGWTHADGQANPEDVVRLYGEMKEKGYEVGKAVRIKRYESPWRKVQGRIWFTIFRTLFPSPYRDVNATPKLMTRRAATVLRLDSHDWFLDPELVIKAIRNHIPICEVETVWRSRKSGSTRAHLLTGLEFLKNLILYRTGVK
ncbi:glycosyltransferase family 2 protein [Candidatus Kaiserbacteria bacterium]|nr:glycosyltransferase family 2 protein [Candidatus Kaiserbacteria bacterium]